MKLLKIKKENKKNNYLKKLLKLKKKLFKEIVNKKNY